MSRSSLFQCGYMTYGDSNIAPLAWKWKPRWRRSSSPPSLCIIALDSVDVWWLFSSVCSRFKALSNWEIQVNYCIQGKSCPRFIYALFALRPEGEFKTGPIEIYIKDYTRKLEGGRIQDWANQFPILRGQK